jgi:hypothetical protein
MIVFLPHQVDCMFILDYANPQCHLSPAAIIVSNMNRAAVTASKTHLCKCGRNTCYAGENSPGMLHKSCCYAGSGQHVDDEGVPQWRLRCQREAELDTLSTKLADLSKSMLDKVRRCTRKLAASTAVAHLIAEVFKLGHTCKLKKLPVV